MKPFREPILMKLGLKQFVTRVYSTKLSFYLFPQISGVSYLWFWQQLTTSYVCNNSSVARSSAWNFPNFSQNFPKNFLTAENRSKRLLKNIVKLFLDIWSFLGHDSEMILLYFWKRTRKSQFCLRSNNRVITTGFNPFFAKPQWSKVNIDH